MTRQKTEEAPDLPEEAEEETHLEVLPLVAAIDLGG